MAVLGEIAANPYLPHLGKNLTWLRAKQFWFDYLGYRTYSEEVDRYHEAAEHNSLMIASAPARTSKSFATAHEILPYFFPTDPPTDSLHWIIGPTYEVNKEFDYCWELLVRDRDRWHGIAPRLGQTRNNPGNGDMTIVVEHGKMKDGRNHRAVIRGLSSTNERMLQGEEVSTCVLSEAAEHPERIYTKYISTRAWKTYLPTTPKPYATWIKERIDLAEQDPTLGIFATTFPRESNPNYNKARYEQARRQAEIRTGGNAEDDPYFAEQFMGHWRFYTGMVLPFNESRHIIPAERVDLSKAHKIFVSVDYGYDHPAAAIFWALIDGIYVIFDELKLKKKDTPTFCDAVYQKLEGHGVKFDYVTGDPRRPEVESIFRKMGLPVITMNKQAQSDRAAGHTHLVNLLTEGPVKGKPGLVLTDNCIHIKQEWQNLRYKDGAADEYGKGAVDGDDDFYDAGRYGAMTMPRKRAEIKEKDWVTEWQRTNRKRQAAWVSYA